MINNHFQSIIVIHSLSVRRITNYQVIHRFHGFFIPLKSYNKAKSEGNNVI